LIGVKKCESGTCWFIENYVKSSENGVEKNTKFTLNKNAKIKEKKIIFNKGNLKLIVSYDNGGNLIHKIIENYNKKGLLKTIENYNSSIKNKPYMISEFNYNINNKIENINSSIFKENWVYKNGNKTSKLSQQQDLINFYYNNEKLAQIKATYKDYDYYYKFSKNGLLEEITTLKNNIQVEKKIYSYTFH